MGAILLEWWALSFLWWRSLGVFANKILIPSSCSNFTGLWTTGWWFGATPFFVALQVWFKFKIYPDHPYFWGFVGRNINDINGLAWWLADWRLKIPIVANPEDPGILAWRTSNKPQPNLVLATRRGQDSGSWPWLYCRIWNFPCTGVAGLADRYPLDNVQNKIGFQPPASTWLISKHPLMGFTLMHGTVGTLLQAWFHWPKLG